jgi:hypothetical protein
MPSVERGEEAATGIPDIGRPARSARFALVAFIAVEAVALPLWLTLGRDQWFFYDEWDFFVDRSATDLGDLFRPHVTHWSTLPILVYRLLWQVVGLRTYLPYQALTVLLHLVVAALLRVIMRRAGVRPWIATAAAALFAFFGTGSDNIVQAFQIGFNASLVFGLIHLLLADHDGSFDRRDALGIGAGLAGLLCSGVAVPMTIAVGLAVLVRRGWRMAVIHTVPLGVLYLLWSLRYADSRRTSPGLSFDTLSDFLASNVRATFVALGQLPGAGVLLGAVLVVGTGLTWARLRDNAELRARAAPAAALLVSAFVFLVTAGVGRAGPAGFGNPTPEASRYMHVAAALTLPALALAASTVADQWRRLAPLVPAIFLVGIPGNVQALNDHMDEIAPYQHAFKRDMVSLPRSPVAARVPRWARPLSVLAPPVTIGWLLDAAASGRLPDPGTSTQIEAATRRLRLSLVPDDRGKAFDHCRVLSQATLLTLRRGDSIAARGARPSNVSLSVGDGQSLPLALGPPPFPHRVLAVVDKLTVNIQPAEPGVMLCERPA